MRDGYPGDAARYPDQLAGYIRGPVPDDQRTSRDWPARAVPAEDRAERGRPDGDGGQRTAAGKTGQKRRTGPPAALPPGPSAGRAEQRAPVHDDEAERSQRATDGAEAADSPHSTGSAAGQGRDVSAGAAKVTQPTSAASAPPSPSGIIPPAVGEVPNSAPRLAGSNEAADPDEVGPDDETTPMAVILGGTPQGQGAQDHAGPAESSVKRMRGPFEPPEKSDPVEASEDETSIPDAARASVWSPAAAKMDQIKDLYLTAEAIGEDALDKHFELVSDRQRQLIREYFNEIGGSEADSHDSAS